MESPNSTSSDETLQFIHFGCWNQGGCSTDGTNPLSLVMQKLTSYIRRHDIQFITVAGDNYYPNKEGKGDEKTKTIIPADLESGFSCLPKDIPIYLLLGNHDLDNSKKLKMREGEGEEVKPPACFILDKERELIENLQLIRPKNEGRKLVMHKVVGTTLLLMIDTTMYDLEDTPDKPDPTFLCYDKEIGVPKNTSNLASLLMAQKEEVESIISTMNENHVTTVIVLGHHPLFVVKTKKGKLLESVLDKAYSLFYDTIFLKFKGNSNIKYFYLCADFHSYQSGEIRIQSLDDADNTMIIHQEIVGTGGTELDDVVHFSKRKTDGIQVNNMRISYVVEKNSRAYGFLYFKVVDGIADYRFKPLLRARSMTIKREPPLKGGKKTRKVKKSSVKHTPLRITR